MNIKVIEMFRNFGVIAVIALLSGCAATAPPAQHIAVGHQAAEELAVLEAMDRYMTAISESDSETLLAMQTPDGMTYQWRPTGDGDMHITAHPNSYWAEPSEGDAPVFRERYWSPNVMIRGAIAVVWAPYEFWIDAKTSHCGVDVFDFVRIDGKWLVSNSMWTVEPESCTELRPVDATKLRPDD